MPNVNGGWMLNGLFCARLILQLLACKQASIFWMLHIAVWLILVLALWFWRSPPPPPAQISCLRCCGLLTQSGRSDSCYLFHTLIIATVSHSQDEGSCKGVCRPALINNEKSRVSRPGDRCARLPPNTKQPVRRFVAVAAVVCSIAHKLLLTGFRRVQLVNKTILVILLPQWLSKLLSKGLIRECSTALSTLA